MNVVEKFTVNADSDADALIEVKNLNSMRTRSRRALWRHVGKLCGALAGLGVGRNDHVLILSESRLEVTECVLAAMNIGAAALPVNPLFSETELDHILGNYPAACCFIDETVGKDKRRYLRNNIATLIDISGRISDPDILQFEALVQGVDAAFGVNAMDDHQLALVIHSSGSQGTPKSILYSHGELGCFMDYHDWLFDQYYAGERNPGDHPLVVTLPFCHLAGLCVSLQGLLMNKPTYFLRRFTPEAYLQVVHHVRSILMILVPSMYMSLLKHDMVKQGKCKFVKFCLSVGEPTTSDLIDQIADAFDALVLCAYGMTECQPGLMLDHKALFSRDLKKGSCGRHIFGEIRLVDRDGNDRDDYGELWVKNETVHECYGDPALNREKFCDGWLKTGDIFRKDEDGFFFHMGRVDNMFVCNGKNIFPAEIESVLSRHPAIEIACATGVKDRRQCTVPAVLIKSSMSMDDKEIVEFSLKNGPAHLVPKFIRFTDEMPLVGPSKVNRTASREILQAEYERAFP